MQTINATELRRELFHVLDAIENGAAYEITRNGQTIARLTPMPLPDWRARIRNRPELLGDAETAFAPLDDWAEWQ